MMPVQAIPAAAPQLPPQLLSRVTFCESERMALRGRPDLTPSQWAERRRQVNKGSAQGQWLNSRTPYLVEPMDTWAQP